VHWKGYFRQDHLTSSSSVRRVFFLFLNQTFVHFASPDHPTLLARIGMSRSCHFQT